MKGIKNETQRDSSSISRENAVSVKGFRVGVEYSIRFPVLLEYPPAFTVVAELRDLEHEYNDPPVFSKALLAAAYSDPTSYAAHALITL